MAKQEDRLEDVPVDRIYPSPTQPRQVFVPADMEELKASIAERGLDMRVLLRERKAGGFELVDGERRWRAHKELGIRRIPAIVRALTDLEAHSIQVRAFVLTQGIPLYDQAKAIESLRTLHGLSVAAVTARLGLSRTTVQSRRRLLTLGETGVSLVRTGDLPASHGTLVAALSPREQAQALQLIMQEDGPVSFRDAERIVQQIRGPRGAQAPEPARSGKRRRAAVSPEVEAFRAAVRQADDPAVSALGLIAHDLLHSAPKASAMAIEILGLRLGDNVLRALKTAKPEDVALVALELYSRWRAGTSERELQSRLSAAAKRLGGK